MSLTRREVMAMLVDARHSCDRVARELFSEDARDLAAEAHDLLERAEAAEMDYDHDNK